MSWELSDLNHLRSPPLGASSHITWEGGALHDPPLASCGSLPSPFKFSRERSNSRFLAGRSAPPDLRRRLLERTPLSAQKAVPTFLRNARTTNARDLDLTDQIGAACAQAFRLAFPLSLRAQSLISQSEPLGFPIWLKSVGSPLSYYPAFVSIHADLAVGTPD